MKKLNFYITNLLKVSPYTKLIAIVRSILALALILTLLSNNIRTLIKPADGIKEYPKCDGIFGKFTIFCSFNQDSYFDLALTKYVVIFLLILVVIGYLPQLMGVIHFWIAYSIQNSFTSIDGGEQVTAVILFWLMLFSLFDNRINHWHYSKSESKIGDAVGWAILLIVKLQISYLYLNSAVTKLKNKEWIDGTAVYYYLNDSLYGLPNWLYDILSIFIETPVIALVTWSTLIIQLTLAGSIFANQDFKNFIFIIALLMHEIFALFMGLVSFSLIMLSVLIIYLKPINIKSGALYEKNNISSDCANTVS